MVERVDRSEALRWVPVGSKKLKYPDYSSSVAEEFLIKSDMQLDSVSCLFLRLLAERGVLIDVC